MALLTLVGCTRRPLSLKGCGEQSGYSAEIEVSVDWSLSGYDPAARSDENYIHRVSFRFFPLDGSEPFDRYLENDVERGTIFVPEGEYSVVVFNESIDDSYWKQAIRFEDCDNYTRFAAELVDQNSELYFYEPATEELLSVEALFLASASVDRFVVSREMCTTEQWAWSEGDLSQIAQLNPVTPRRLTCATTLEAQMENLSSAFSVHASLTGLSQRVFMASGDPDTATTTHVGELTQREWEDNLQHGTISESRLTFTTPQSGAQHTLTLDIILVDGSHHEPEEPLVYDVTDQIVSSATATPATRYADNDLGASVSLSLPEVSGDVEVDEWGDEDTVTIK